MKLTKPDIDAPNIEWALYWAGRGWQVFPVWWPIDGEKCACGLTHKDSGKHPINSCAPEGFKNGTTDTNVIRGWWERYPEASIASTPLAGQVVIDIDGPLDEGVEFPATWTHKTGKGEHRVYANNIEFPLPQSQKKLWTNVDTRTSGNGYIVLPPSLHQSGTRYAILEETDVIEFPSSMAKDATQRKRTTVAKPADSEIIKLLTCKRDDPSLGDDAMAKVAGYLARYLPDKEHWEATITAVNQSLASPLDETAMHKKRNIWDKHQERIEADKAQTADDESRGWLYEMGDVGYSTPIEVRGTVEYVPFTDFRVHCRGVVTGEDSIIFIVDFYRNDVLVREGEKLSASILSSTSKLREWLANRDLLLHANAKDSRNSPGIRLMALFRSQNPRQMKSRDFYGWCPETEAFLIERGEVTVDGLRPYTDVYPDDKLINSSPVNFDWSADIDQARGWLTRTLDLQPPQEAAKIGAWGMMLLLRGQWEGILPGLSVDAFAGTGKTTFFKLFSRLMGSTNEGETLTAPAATAQLTGNASGFVWLDDTNVDDKMQQLLRQAVTQQRTKKMGIDVSTGDWGVKGSQLRGSVVLSGEGSEIGRQKAIRDRFVPVDFVVNPTPDAEKLMKEHIERGSGALLVEVLKQAHMLPELSKLRDDVSTRDKQAQTTLRMGARILDAVLQTGTKWTDIIDAWFNGAAIETDQGNASENILHVFPRVWLDRNMPTTAGTGEVQINPIWYNQIEKRFYIHATRCNEAWGSRGSGDRRSTILTSKQAMVRELQACGAEGKLARTKVDGNSVSKPVNYLVLSKRYSDMILSAVDHVEDKEDA